MEREGRTDPGKGWDLLPPPPPAGRNLGSLSYLARHTLTFSRASACIISSDPQPQATREQKGHLGRLEGPVASARQLLAPAQAARSCLGWPPGVEGGGPWEASLRALEPNLCAAWRQTALRLGGHGLALQGTASWPGGGGAVSLRGVMGTSQG